MKLGRVSSVIVFVFLIASVGSQSTLAQGSLGQGEPRTGTWKLNLAKSKYNPGPRWNRALRRFVGSPR
jgi:hypothetical protein